jgi:hypothetical protein
VAQKIAKERTAAAAANSDDEPEPELDNRRRASGSLKASVINDKALVRRLSPALYL